jgi:hypothetical protein
VWDLEIGPTFPGIHWDHWMRDPARHLGRDIIIPEIPRDYHAGVKGTYMDVPTHNTYFGSIALQADPKFSWDTLEVRRARARNACEGGWGRAEKRGGGGV